MTLIPNFAEQMLAEQFFHDEGALQAHMLAVPCSLAWVCSCRCRPEQG